MERAISLPFSIDASGAVSSTNNQRKLWQDRVISAVMTNLGERVMRPGYGTVIKSMIFETEGIAVSMIKNSVEKAFSSYLPSLQLQNVNPVMDPQLGVLTVTIEYNLPNGEFDQVLLDAIPVKSGYINISGDIIQEL